MKIIREWRGPRESWSLRTKVVAFAVALVLGFAFVVAVDILWSRADGWFGG